MIAKRLVTLYTSEQTSTLDVILGARSLDDMINRMDGAKSVTSLDAIGARSRCSTFQTAVKRNGLALASARTPSSSASSRSAQRAKQLDRVADRRAAPPALVDQGRDRAASRPRRPLASCRWPQRRRRGSRRCIASRSSRRPTRSSASRPSRRRPTRSSRRRRRTRASSASRSRSSARRTCGPARRPAASTARGSSCGRTRRSASRCRTRRTRSGATECSVSRDQLQPGDLVFFDGLGHVGHLHRRRAVRARPAHRRRRQDLEPRRELVRVDLRRRPPDSLELPAERAREPISPAGADGSGSGSLPADQMYGGGRPSYRFFRPIERLGVAACAWSEPSGRPV